MMHKKLYSLSLEELYQNILPEINKVKQSYNYIRFEEDEYKKISFKAIKKSLKNLKEHKDSDFSASFYQNLRTVTNEYIKEKMQDEQEFLIIVSNYIEKNIKKYQRYDKVYNNFRKLVSFFREINFVPTADLVLALIKNNREIEFMLKIVVKANGTFIKEKEIQEIFPDEIAISFIDIYCRHQKINFDELQDNGKNCENVQDTDLALLTKEEERMLAYRIQESDDKAKEEFIMCNLKLVGKIAGGYTGLGLDYDDLVQEGIMGLIKAVERFDVTKGFRFSTFAVRLISQSIRVAVASQGRNINLNIHQYEKIKKFKKTYSLLQSKLYREPTIEEIAMEMNISASDATNIYYYQKDILSLNVPVGEENDMEFGDFIPVEEYTDEQAIAHIRDEQIEKILNDEDNLTEREREVILHRFGFVDGEPKTLEETGNIIGVSKERVRKVEQNALKKLRHPTLSRKLKDFY